MTRSAKADVDVVVVGAGFAGIYALHKVRQAGLTVMGIEAAPDVGGTWYWNSYPGARCDVSSYNYAYFFDPEIVRQWQWSDSCAEQREIQSYLRFCAEKCGVVDLIRFNTRVTSAHYEGGSGTWTVTMGNGESVCCRYVIMAIGALSTPKAPDIEGVDDFKGLSLLTSNWPKDREIDFRGKRVGVIGTGSSGIQIIPEMAKVARSVHVFQRTANYVIPTESGPIDENKLQAIRKDPITVRQELRTTYAGLYPLGIGAHKFHELDEAGRQQALETAWEGNYIALAFRDAYLPEANAAISDFVRKKMLEVVRNPKTAHELVPWDHPYGGKRPCRSDTYLQTFNEPHVRLVSLKHTPIVRIEPDGIKTTEEKIELDAIIYATGFDAITGAVFSIDIEGLDGQTMKQAWKDGPVNYLGTMVHGFPNMFFPSSALSPSVLTNMATLAEQQIDYIVDTMLWLERHGYAGIQPKLQSQFDWRDEVFRYAQRYPGALTTNSWYNGANLPGKPRVFMIYCGGFHKYNDRCMAELKSDFPGYEVLR